MLGRINVTELLIKALVLFTALPVHECAHALVASKLGDNTAKNMGRITLNPMKHLDLIGSIAMIVVGFGWAKPVPINPRNFKNPKLGMAISSAAGPISNILMAFVVLIIYKVLYYIGIINGFYLENLYRIFVYMITLNIGLGVFNLLPIPPLDGSRIATLFLSNKTYFKIMQYEQYIFIGLIVVLYSGILDVPLGFLTDSIFDFLNISTGFVDMIFKAVNK